MMAFLGRNGVCLWRRIPLPFGAACLLDGDDPEDEHHQSWQRHPRGPLCYAQRFVVHVSFYLLIVILHYEP